MHDGGQIRLKLTIHYDGRDFHGWQAQPDARTVQGEIEAAIQRLTGARRAVLASGRTDAGVHATGQVASLLVPSKWTPTEFRRAMNAVLPDDVWLHTVERCPDDFHARYHAVARTYGYRLGLTDEAWSPFARPWCWPLGATLDTKLLARAAQVVVGDHSFASFAKAGQPERGDRCRVVEARWSPWELGLLFTITADRYLHHMVRYVVGTMVDVARGRRPLEDVGALLDPARTDLETSPPAPPEGLFLLAVEYSTSDTASESGPSTRRGAGPGPKPPLKR